MAINIKLMSKINFACSFAFTALCPKEISFIILDEKTDRIVHIIGNRHTERITPALTFKIVLSWYSRILSAKTGLVSLSRYLALFDYGNQDLSGDPEKNNGLTHAWLSSSLKISLIEQIYFLQKLVQEKLPVSKYAMLMTKNILYVETIDGHWNFFGKAGTGYSGDNSNTIISWYVGWIEKASQIYLFALNICGDDPITPKAERMEIIKSFFREAKIFPSLFQE